MSFRHSLARALVLVVLTFGAMMGVAVDPRKIEELMNVMHRTKIVRVMKQDDPE